MSELKGTLLAIVLAVAVFAVVFPIITTSLQTNANTIAGRMKDAAELEPDVKSVTRKGYSIHY